jgi:hypothetical protein
VSDPIIEITPSPDYYRQLVRDLEALRAAGAASNTVAIVEAVHTAAADARRMAKPKKTAGHRANGPGPEPGG